MEATDTYTTFHERTYADIGDPVEDTDWHVIYIGDQMWRVARADGTTFETRWQVGEGGFGRYLQSMWEEDQEEAV